MLEEACKSEDGRVKLIALRILELQNKRIPDLELETGRQVRLWPMFIVTFARVSDCA